MSLSILEKLFLHVPRPVDDQPQKAHNKSKCNLYTPADILGTSFGTRSGNLGEYWIEPNLSIGSTDILDDYVFLKIQKIFPRYFLKQPTN